jgi:DHA3 family macrolide efflux protein-like MFS transporter
MGLIGVGIGALLIGLTPATLFLLAVAAALWVGFMLPITNGPLFAVIQAVVAPEMQGRVISLIESLATAMAPLGLALAGPIADVFGVRLWFVAAGLITGLMGIVGFLTPTVLYLEDQKTPVGAAEQATDFPVGAPRS